MMPLSRLPRLPLIDDFRYATPRYADFAATRMRFRDMPPYACRYYH